MSCPLLNCSIIAPSVASLIICSTFCCCFGVLMHCLNILHLAPNQKPNPISMPTHMQISDFDSEKDINLHIFGGSGQNYLKKWKLNNCYTSQLGRNRCFLYFFWKLHLHCHSVDSIKHQYVNCLLCFDMNRTWKAIYSTNCNAFILCVFIELTPIKYSLCL